MHSDLERPGHSLVAASDADLTNSHLFYITDKQSRLRFLVDTGIEVSIVHRSRAVRANHQGQFILRPSTTPTLLLTACPRPWTQTIISFDLHHHQCPNANSWSRFTPKVWLCGGCTATSYFRLSHTLKDSR